MKISKHQIYTKKNIFKLRKPWKTHNKAIINKKNRTIQKTEQQRKFMYLLVKNIPAQKLPIHKKIIHF